MKFASVTQIIVLSVVTCAGLFALDYWKNPQLWHHPQESATPAKGMRLTLWMNYLSCTTCMDEVREALKTVPGIDGAAARTPAALPTKAQAEQIGNSQSEYGNTVELAITDLDKLDFAALDKALRDKGLVAGRMELGGIEHFRLEATVNHLCCGACTRALQERVAFLKAKAAGGQFRWLDSLGVDNDKKLITAYARYLEPGKTVDVTDFIMGLNDIGYVPTSVRVEVGEPMKMASHVGH